VTATPGWAWAAAGGVILGLLAADLVASRGPTRMRRAVAVSAGWVAAGTGFGLVLTLSRGATAGQEYFAAYLLEKALSIDNVVVFALLFQAFAVPAAYRHRVLLAGVLGALALRGGFIAAGAALASRFSWTFYLFGVLLLAAAVRMGWGGVAGSRPPGGTGSRPPGGLALRGLRRIVPVTEDFDGPRFLTRRGGRRCATPLLAAAVAIETTDVIFAADSIPAVFGVTTETFIVFTSNAFAVLGLRALYFVLAGAMERFSHLRLGLAVLLAFIGAKMLLAEVVHVPTVASLGLILAVIAVSAGLSQWQERRAARPGPPRPGPARPPAGATRSPT
jgi:tellurite resistance protein TerC